MVAGTRFELAIPGYEPSEIPFLHPATSSLTHTQIAGKYLFGRLDATQRIARVAVADKLTHPVPLVTDQLVEFVEGKLDLFPDLHVHLHDGSLIGGLV